MPRGVYDHDEIKSEDEALRIWKRCDDEGNELATFVEAKDRPPSVVPPETVIVHLQRHYARLAILCIVSGAAGAVIEALAHH